MQIGIVTTWFERGAAYVSKQFMELLQQTDDVYIYARGGEKYAIGNPKWDLPNVHWGKKDKAYCKLLSGTYIDKNDFKKWIDDNKIELILFNEQQWFTPLLWCKEWKIKTAAYIDYYTEETIPLYGIYDCLICNTKRHAFAFRDNPKVKYLKWGTDINLYKPAHEEHERLTFFTSAGMAPVRKGTDYVIKAFYNIIDRNKAKLIVHTQVPLDKTIPEVTPMVEEMIAEGSLEVVEKTVTAPGLYSKADVYVYPSRLDGIGLTLMEAAASGLACITINNAPMNEFVDESFGRLCDVEYYYSRKDGYYWPLSATDVKSLSQIMERFVDGDENVSQMKQNAREYAERELDFSKNIASLHEVLVNTEYSLNQVAAGKIDRYENTGFKKVIKKTHLLASIYYLLKK